MRIGILGSGFIGGKLGTLFARAGHDVTFSYARSRWKLDQLAEDAGNGSRAGSPAEAAANADVILLAVHWSRVDDVLARAGSLAGRTVITCSLPMSADDSGLALGHTTSGAEALAARLPEARIVSAFSTTPSEALSGVFDRREQQPRPSLVYCGDHDSAKAVAATLMADIGFDPIDLGALQAARLIEPFSLLLGSIAYDGKGTPEVIYRIDRV